MKFLIVFLTAFVLAWLLSPLTARLGQQLGLTDRPGGRRRHKGEISRLGGIALFGGFMGAALLVFGLSALKIWPPLGAAAVGEKAAAHYFKRTSWLFDLERT